MNPAREIAEASLEKGAIKLQAEEPFTWASGFRMPIYNDNRKLLSDYSCRNAVKRGFEKLLHSQQKFSLDVCSAFGCARQRLDYDMIAGTSTAGIAPAAGLSQRYQVPLVIVENGSPYVFESGLNLFDRAGFVADAVASTSPWAIPLGVKVADRTGLPFMYVRQSKKDHGMNQQIEGMPIRGTKTILLDYHLGESYALNAVDALNEKGLDVVEVISKDISEFLQKPKSLDGKKILMIEDLISTGGSSAKAVQEIRNCGAVCDNCLSIFSYGFPDAKKEFDNLEGGSCNASSILTYDVLLDVAKEKGYINNSQAEMLAEWRNDPFGWGEKHGFPRVVKKK